MRILVFSLFVFMSSILFGQQDSLSIDHYKIRQSVWGKFASNPITFQQVNFNDFTETSLYTTIKNQPVSKIQTPNKVQYIGFKSKGVFSLKNNIKLFGNLDFSRSYAQESSYLLMHNLSEEFSNSTLQNPIYPIASRSGDSENQHYKLMAGFSGLMLNKIPFSVKLNYNTEKYFGLNIPKTEQEVLDYNGVFQLGYQFKNNTIYSVLELRRSQNNFDYNAPSNTSASINSVTELETYAGFSVGYGDVLGFSGTLLRGLTVNDTFLIGGGYNFKKGAHLFDVSYTYTDTKEKYFSTEFIDDLNLAAVFNTEELALNLNYTKQTEKQLVLANVKGILAEGVNTHVFEDFVQNDLNRIAKQNYKHEVQKLFAGIEWLKLNDDTIELGLKYTSELSNTSIIDLNTTDKNITYWNNSLSFIKDINLLGKSFLNIEVGVSYFAPLSESLEYSFTTSSTSTGVSVIPLAATIGTDLIESDHTFDTTHRVGQFFALSYPFKLNKGKIANIVANYSYLMASDGIPFSSDNKIFGITFNLQY